MYIINLTYKVELSEIDKHLAAHVKFLKEQYKSKNFIASGRKIPRNGGIILSNMRNKDELLEVIKKDLFNINNLAEYHITEFIPSMTCKELEFLKE
jgi:uncharacterized protein YciI